MSAASVTMTAPSQSTSSLREKINSRCDIVRTLATLIISKHGPHPTKSEVEHISRQVILKFPFMRDDIGTGYVTTNIIIGMCVLCLCMWCMCVCMYRWCVYTCVCMCVRVCLVQSSVHVSIMHTFVML